MLVLAATLPRPAFEVRFLLLWERGPWAAEADLLGVPVHVLGLRPQDCTPPGLRCAKAAARALRRYVALTQDVDVVDAWLIPSLTFAALSQPFARVPVLLGGRRSLVDLYEHKPWYRKVAATWASRRMDVIVANSQAAAREAITRDGLDPARVEVIVNAVIPLATRSTERSAWRRRWGFATHSIVIGCVANYKVGKGLEVLVEVARRLRAESPDLRYVLVGEGSLRQALETQIGRSGLQSIVVLNGRVDDARCLYPAFDIAVQASATEGMPNVVLEAAAAGRPIVATAVGGTSEVLTSEENGLLVPSGDVDALADAIQRLAHDPALRQRLGRSAELRSADYSSARFTAATAGLYTRLVRARQP